MRGLPPERSAGQPFQADATIRNEGLGEGEVQVVFRVVARSGEFEVDVDSEVDYAPPPF